MNVLKELLGVVMICLICAVYYFGSIILIAALFIGLFGSGK